MEDTSKSLSRLLPLVWAERTMNLIDLLTDVALPDVVKMQTDGKPAESASTLSQPLLLYKELKGVKVVARNVSSLEPVGKDINKDGVKYRESNSVVFFPVDYPGWFRVLEDETVPLKTISSMARVMPVSFLSSKKVTGFSLLDPSNTKDIMYEKLQYPPGLYYVHNIYEDYVKYKDNKHVTKRKLLRCLVCVAEEGLEVLFPFDVEGDFYIVEAKKAASKSAVNDKNSCAYTLKQLVAMGAFTRPLVLQVLIGEPPTKPCGFTSVVKVFDIIQERSVIASCLDGSRRLMELPVLPYPQFLRALNGKDLLETGSLRPELMFMSGGAADKYAREIKVRQNIPLQENDKILAAQHFEKQLQKQPVQSRSPRRAADRSKPPLSQSLDSKLTEKPMFKQYPIEGNLPRKSTDKQTEIQTREKQSPVDVEENHIYINPFEGQLSKPKKDKQKFTNAKVKQGSKDTSNNKKI